MTTLLQRRFHRRSFRNRQRPTTPGEAQRFLTQATFGATADDIADLVERGDYREWIRDQWDLPISRTLPAVIANGNSSNRQARHYIWWRNLMEEPDQLRQRVAFALSEIFVISDLDYEIGNTQYGVCHYYDMLAEHADGNFRDLLTAVTLHPVMGIYLSMLRNQKADPERNIRPDENYARELLQLFTIGLYLLDEQGEPQTINGEPVPTFDQAIVEEFARVFTGWNYSGEVAFDSNNIESEQKRAPMWAIAEEHDDGAKVLLNGEHIPAGLTPREDLDAALDNVFAHANVGPFVSRLLIQRLVTSNPTPAYVGRVAAVFNDNGSGVRGDLGATVEAILLDDEARSGRQTLPAQFGKVKEPLLRVTQFFRAFQAFPGPEADIDGASYVLYDAHQDAIDNISGQAILQSPSVFNFFQPGYSPAGTDLVAPEMQIHTEANVASMNNAFHSQIYFLNNREDGSPPITRIDVEREIALAEDIDALIDHLDTLLLGDAMTDADREALRTHLAVFPDDEDGFYNRALDAIFLVVASPNAMLQR